MIKLKRKKLIYDLKIPNLNGANIQNQLSKSWDQDYYLIERQA